MEFCCIPKKFRFYPIGKEEISKGLKHRSGLIRFQFYEDNPSGSFEDSFVGGETVSRIQVGYKVLCPAGSPCVL